MSPEPRLTIRVRVPITDDVIAFFEHARNGTFAEKVSALEFAKIFGYAAEQEEFTAECLNEAMHRCTASTTVDGRAVVCDRRSHEGNPWHVALSNGRRYAWGPMGQHVRPLMADEEVP